MLLDQMQQIRVEVWKYVSVSGKHACILTLFAAVWEVSAFTYGMRLQFNLDCFLTTFRLPDHGMLTVV